MSIEILGEGKDVFSFWDKNINDSPLVVKMADYSWRKYASETGSKFHKITEQNMQAYEALLDDEAQRTLMKFRGNFQDYEPHWSWMRYSECLRLALLAKFGGIWADGTVCVMPGFRDWLPVYKGLLLPPHAGTSNMEMESWFILCRNADDSLLQEWNYEFLRYCADLGLRSQILGKPRWYTMDYFLRELTRFHPALTRIWFSKLVKSIFRIAPYFAMYYFFSMLIRKKKLGNAYQYHLPYDASGWVMFNRSDWLGPIPEKLENRILKLPIIKLCYKSNRGVTTIDSVPEGSMLDEIFSRIEPEWKSVMIKAYPD